jgi:Predicted membrane protein (DUF2157)/Domain of unknown function (DUF4401)
MRPLKAQHVLAVAGATALVLGLIFVIAFNWAGLGKLPKFALLQGLLIVLSAAALMRGLSSTIGKGLLTMALGCIGPLLAVFGQTYQTGADVWQLFVAWAALGVVWALAARSGAAWLAWIIIAQAALWLHLDAFYDLSRLHVESVPLWLLVLIVNGGLLAVWEFAATRFSWLEGRAAPRIIAALLLFAMTSAAMHAIFWNRSQPQSSMAHWAPFIGWIVLMAAGFFWYGRGRRDIVIVTMGWVALATTALAIVIKVLLNIDLFLTVFICFFLALGLLGFGVQWLRKNFAGGKHWIVDLAAALGAWISMLLLVLLVGIMVVGLGGNLLESRLFWFVMAAIAATAAVTIAAALKPEQVFRNQLVNVLSLAAPTLTYLGIAVQRGSTYENNRLLAVYTASAMALALWFLLRSKQARSLMSLAVIYGLIAALHQLGLGILTVWILLALACAIWLLAPNSFLKEEAAIEAAAVNVNIHRLTEFGYALSLWALVIGASFRSYDRWGFWYLSWQGQDREKQWLSWTTTSWLPSAVALLIALAVALVLAQKIRFLQDDAPETTGASITKTFGTGSQNWLTDPLMLGLGLVAAVLSAWYAPYLLACATFFALGAATERLKLTALATFGMIASLFQYYFELALPLWMKGGVLALLGLLLLTLAWRTAGLLGATLRPQQGVPS